MSDSTSAVIHGPRLQVRTAVGIIVLLWAAYTAIYSLPLHDTLAGAVLELVPGALGIGALLAAGFRPRDCYLRLAPISMRGLAVLGAVFLILPVLLLSGQWVGFRFLPMLVLAPASGIAQELFFRAALLPALVGTFERRPVRAVALHAVLFALWHVPRVLMTAPVAPVPGAVAVAVVTFLAGMGWGWQVQHDRTLAWALAQHVLFLASMSLFGL